MGGPSTISQLKESIRLNLPELIFICETKQSNNFIKIVYENLKYRKRWDTVEPVGRRGGMLVAWNKEVQLKSIRKTDFCYELQVDLDELEDYG